MIPFASECEETAPTCLSAMDREREGGEASVCKCARISALVTKINWIKKQRDLLKVCSVKLVFTVRLRRAGS